MNNVYAIIVTYNPDIELLNQQFESLKDQVKGIVYIDNGSTNICELKKFHQYITQLCNVLYVYNDSNTGLGFAQNQGIKVAFNAGASHILLLDHDSVIQQGFIKGLLSTENKQLNSGIKVGLVGPIFFNPITKEQYPVIIVKGFIIKKIRPKEGITIVSYTIASGSLIRKTVLEEVGLMDEELFVDFIDNEWCWRAKHNGYQIVVTSDAVMQHIIGDRRMTFLGINLSSHSPLRRYYSCRNTILTFRYKYFPLASNIRALFIHIMKIFILAIKSPDRYKYIKYSCIGMIDGMRNIKGPCTIKG